MAGSLRRPFDAPLRAAARDSRHPRARGAHAQPEEHRSRPAARAARGHHRLERLREVQPRLRHAVCGRAAALRREPVGLCAAVPAADGQARCRRDRRAVAGDQHRAEGHQPQPALDRRHHHRDPRLPAPAVCARRHAILPRSRPAARCAKRRPDGRRGAWPARGHAADGAGAGGARSQGRVRRAVRRHAGAGLCALSRRRHGARVRRAAQAEEDREARHRCRRRPAEDAV